MDDQISDLSNEHTLDVNNDSESAELNQIELPPSNTDISKIYEKSKKFDVSKELVSTKKNLTNLDVLSKSEPKPNIELSKENYPSTLSLTSTNYQNESSDDSDASNENSTISVSTSPFPKNDVNIKGELDICDLPQIENLKISTEYQPVGFIISVIDTVVIVEAFLNQPTLDIDSVLFVDRGIHILGRIFDVFGPVFKPFYAINFNNSNHIKKFDIQIKKPVYCALPTEYASCILVSELIKIKETDALWKDNNKSRFELLDYSVDKAEKLPKKKQRPKKYTQPSDKDDDTVDKKETPVHPSQSVIKNNTTPRNMTPHSSIQNSNNRTQQTGPRPFNNYIHERYGRGQFLTYAQHLSSIEYSYLFNQPYSPWNYDLMHAPRHPNHQLYMSQRYDNQPQPPMDPSNQFHYPNHFD